jgi:hypothetical protein
MPETMPDFESLTHPELVQLCKAFWQELQSLQKRVERLETENQALKANGGKAKKTSKNSSLPPSKDQKTNVATREEPKKRTYNHQAGGRELSLNPDKRIELKVMTCKDCGANLETTKQEVKAI